jgi:purine-nucleoside phosphorylase
MSVHLGAQKGDIAETVLLPGDPLRAKTIAETFFENPVCYNEVRGMLGFTGTYKGKRISVQGTGMGIPSISIYVNELISQYGAKNLIRVGTCGAFQDHLKIGDVVLAQAASTDSHINRLRFQGMDYAPTADFGLLYAAFNKARELGMEVSVGNILSTDTFYGDDPAGWKHWARFGILAVEMEAAALYTLAAKFGVRALGICTVSDSLARGDSASAEDRQNNFKKMMELALEIAP